MQPYVFCHCCSLKLTEIWKKQFCTINIIMHIFLSNLNMFTINNIIISFCTLSLISLIYFEYQSIVKYIIDSTEFYKIMSRTMVGTFMENETLYF